jgi:hypothetical protein
MSNQFLQAEKKIRVKSLVKMGFLISDVKEIYKDSCEISEKEIESRSNEILDDISDFSFESLKVIYRLHNLYSCVDIV